MTFQRNFAYSLVAMVTFTCLASIGQAQPNPEDKVTPSWNKNDRIYFRYNKTGNGDVYSVREDGSDLKLMIGSPGEDYPPLQAIIHGPWLLRSVLYES